MNPSHKKLGELLIEKQKITSEQLEHALEYHKKTKERLGHALISLGYITEDELIEFLTEQLGVPAIKIDRKMLNPAISRILPFELCMRYRIIPILKNEKTLVIATTDPFNVNFITEIKKVYPFDIELVLAPENAIMEAIEIVFGKVDKNLNYEEQEDAQSIDEKETSFEELERILNRALSLKSREILIRWTKNNMNIFYMTESIVPEQKEMPAEKYDALIKVLKLRSGITDSNEGFYDGLFTVSKPEKEYFLRVHIFSSGSGSTVSIKIS